MITRRDWLKTAFGGSVFLLNGTLVIRDLLAGEVKAPNTVWRTASCSCCKSWIAHLQRSGFDVNVVEVSQEKLDGIKRQHHVPDELQTCHTGVFTRGGTSYVVEGHVPADIIQRALREKPKGTLLAVPGMPIGSPGMEMGIRKDRYDVILYDSHSRKSRVYATR